MRPARLVRRGQAVRCQLPPERRHGGVEPQGRPAFGVLLHGRRPRAGRRARERRGPAGEHLVHQDAEGPHVGGRPHPDAALGERCAPPLGRQAVGRADRRGVAVGAVQVHRQSEVGQPRRAVPGHEDVSGFQVAVHPAHGVQLGEPLAHLGQQPCRRLLRPLVRQHVGEAGRLPLHDQHHGAVEFGARRVVDDDGVQHPHQPRVVDQLSELGLAARAVHQVPCLAGRESGGRQELQRDLVRFSAGRLLRTAQRHPVRHVRRGAAPCGVDGPCRVDRAPAALAEQFRDLPAGHAVAARDRPRRASRRHPAAPGTRCPRRRAGSSGRWSSRTSPKRSATPATASRFPVRRADASGRRTRSFSSAR